MARPKPTDLLREAVEAARLALRDLEPDEVPARLRRVRASSERTLPPPLAVSLLRELARDEALRVTALEAWAGERPPAGGPALASFAFLERAEGWEIDVMDQAIRWGERHGSASDQSVQLERDSLAAEVASLKERLRRERTEAAESERLLQEALAAERAPARSDQRTRRRLQVELEEARATWAARESELVERVDHVETELRRFQEAVRTERAARAEMAAEMVAGATGTFPTDPVGLGRLLDDLVAHTAALVGPSAGHPSGDPGPVTPVALDPSIRPDQAEAVDWLVGAGSIGVLIDGYNLGFQLAGLDPFRARALAIEAGQRLSAVAQSADVTLVFDSSVDVDGEQRGSRSGNLAVIYTSGGSADDAIVDLVCEGHATVVLTNDRQLRQRAERCGAVALWSDALVEWSRRR